MAAWYANQHFKTDTGVETIYYLPKNSDESEIRFLEVNSMGGETSITRLSPIDYGVDFGIEHQHRLLVVNVTPNQLSLVLNKATRLPEGWSLDDAVLRQRPKP